MTAINRITRLCTNVVIITCSCVCTVGVQKGYSQFIGPLTQYYANELIINPAFAGASDALSLTASYRNQWSGLVGAPTTQILSLHSLTKNGRVGVGLALINDKIGVHKNTALMNSYSYRINLDKDTYFSFGVQVGFNYRRSDYASLSTQVRDPNDPSLTSGLSLFKFEFGSGIYFRSPKLRIGFSAPKMLSGRTSMNDSTSLELNRPQYFLFIRYYYPISPNLELQPGLLVKYLPGLPVSVDFNLSANIKQVLLIGASYRLSESIGGILQLNVTPQLKFGYSYDLVTAPASSLSNNSHEIMLNYLFKFTTYEIKNVR